MVESPWEVCAPILLAGSGSDSVLREGAKRPSEPSNMEGGGRSSQSPSSVAQVGTLLVGPGKLWQSRAGSCEGLDPCLETRGEGTSLCTLLLGAHVPFQFSGASVQEDGSALHKLVGDLVDSHRLLSLFVIVSPVLWEKRAALASRGSLGQRGEERTGTKRHSSGSNSGFRNVPDPGHRKTAQV